MKHCSKCKFSLKQEVGYSNWTVEGCDLYCLKGLNKSLPADGWYGECPEGFFAEECSSYIESRETILIDVDKEDGAMENYTNDEELKGLLRIWERNN
jgi:hypothetical protein